MGFAFTGAQRTPLTGEAGGLGAVFSQEGHCGKKTVPVGTYRRELWLCKFGETSVDGGHKKKIKLSRRGDAAEQQRGESVSALLRKANHSKDSLPQSLGGIGQTVQMLPAAWRHTSSGRNRTILPKAQRPERDRSVRRTGCP